ncbi:MAG: DAK2 domain-containing protein, partial [Caldicoprobacterales bacterium]
LYIMMGQARVFDDGFDLEAPLEQLDFYMDSNGIGNRTAVSAPSGFPEESIEFGYCTEFFITNLHPYIRAEDIDKLKAKLERLGDSIVVVGDEDLIKVHFHTNMPGKGLQLGLRFGELTNIKIDNMREQHHHVIEMETGSSTNEPEKNLGLVSVSMGEGIANVFKDLNADYIIEGGQTMNPSIEDILNAVEKVNAREVFVLPNNSNIVLSAKQAAEISKKPIHVVPTKTIPQGLAALIAYNPENDVQTNKNNMTEAIKQVKSGQITYAVRNSRVDEIEIKEGNIMGIMDGNISMVGENIADVTKQLLDRMLEDGGEIVTVFYGSDAAKEDTESIRAYLQEKHNDVDVELLFGGQPLYYYILSVE